MKSMMCPSWRAPSISWKKFEKLAHRIPFIFISMKVWTVRLWARFSLSAGMHLIILWMIFLLLPAMRKFTSIFISASISVCLNKIFSFPLLALLPFIVEYMRFSPEILPIMSIHTSISSMWSITIRAPYCFKVKHIEIWLVIFWGISFIGLVLIFILLLYLRSKFVQQIHSHFILWMCKRAHISVIARFNLWRIALTKLDLVFFRMIEFFNPIVRFRASISKLAIVISLGGYYVGTYFWRISP